MTGLETAFAKIAGSHPTPIGADRPDTTHAELTEVDGRTVVLFQVDGRRSDSSGAAEAEVVVRALELAAQVGCPVLGIVNSVSVSPEVGGLDALVGWGRVAQRAVQLSGVVPLLLAVTGPVHGSLTPLLGLADHVVFTRDATAYINGPGPVLGLTGVVTDPEALGGWSPHSTHTGLASLVVDTPGEALLSLADLLGYLPGNHLEDAPLWSNGDTADRACDRAAAIVPDEASRAYDIRDLLDDVFDRDSLFEVHAGHAANLVCAYARLDGRAVAIVANQPSVRAGTLDIDASCKGARHVQGADALGLPIVTFVDTPGYQPGRELERRGMIRHGAKLVHAYAAATVPRLGVVVRKAYGGAYIVMDSRTMGNDLVVAWPRAEIAVMGAPGAVAIINRREIESADDPVRRRSELESAYTTEFCTPRIAAERGLIDQVVEPENTRRVLAAALRRFATKRPIVAQRRHANGPL